MLHSPPHRNPDRVRRGLSRFARLDKPLDAGNGLVSASIARGGSWLSVGSAHSRLGYVELSGLPIFDDAWRSDPAAVRRYRYWMTEERFPLLSLIPQRREPIDEEHYDLVGDEDPFCGMLFDSYSHEVTTWAPSGLPVVRQRHVLRARRPGAGAFQLRFCGRLDRPALGEITEAGVLPAIDGKLGLGIADLGLEVTAPHLPAGAEIHVGVRGCDASIWESDGPGASLTLEWDRGSYPEATLDIECALWERRPGRPLLDPPDGIGRAATREPVALPAATDRLSPLVMPRSVDGGFEWLTVRALSYTQRCTALVTAPAEVCILTDHRLLPLSWTRDAYYQALLLLSAGRASGVRAVAGHLRWLWDRCDRIDGLWMRSHLPNGAVKDARFQVDQQLYPILELCDYRRTTGELPELPHSTTPAAESRWADLIDEAWRAVPVSAEHGFAPTDETPADDPFEMPFLLSSEILRWYTALRLAELQERLGLPLDIDFLGAADGLRADIRRHFAVPGPHGDQWAYAIDGKGGSLLYNDANDLPTAFAPLWGFCDAGDPHWRATMRFSFDRHNPGYSPGRYGGLGSVHTPGTWPLGDVQEWVAYSLMGDLARAQRPLTRLLVATTADGMLPEAYDSTTGTLTARHWFAWPGALVGALYLAATGRRTPWAPFGPVFAR